MKKFISKFAAISMAAGVLFAPCNIVRAAIPYDNETQEYDDDFKAHEDEIQKYVPNYAQLLETINRSTDSQRQAAARFTLWRQLSCINDKIEAIDIFMEILKYNAQTYPGVVTFSPWDLVTLKAAMGIDYDHSYIYTSDFNIILYVAHLTGPNGFRGAPYSSRTYVL